MYSKSLARSSTDASGPASFLILVFLTILMVGCEADVPEPWTLGTPGPVPRFEAPIAEIDGRILFFGGFVDTLMNVTTRVDSYDPTADEWRQLSDMPAPVTHAMMATIGRSIWMAGGFEGAHPGESVASVWRYDVDEDLWEEGPPLPGPRASGALVAVGNRLHHFGGFGPGRDDTVSDHWSLDVTAPGLGWQEESPLPEARGHIGALVVDGLIYAVGGQFMHDFWPIDLPNVDVFDPARGEWEPAPSMPSSRSHMEPGIFHKDGRIYVYGGRDNTQARWAVDDAIVYDIESSTWSQGESLPGAMLAPVVRPFDGGLMVAAGSLEIWNRPQTRVYRRP